MYLCFLQHDKNVLHSWKNISKYLPLKFTNYIGSVSLFLKKIINKF
jgi:hypothetical protein